MLNFHVRIYNTVRDTSSQRASWSGRFNFRIQDTKIRKLVLSKVSTTIFKDFMRCRRFRNIHAEEASHALSNNYIQHSLREDAFCALASLAIRYILINIFYSHNELENLTGKNCIGCPRD